MLEYVQLSFCILEPNFQGPSNSLKELSLCFVPLVNGEVEATQVVGLDILEMGFSAPNLDIFLYYGNFGVYFFPSYVPNEKIVSRCNASRWTTTRFGWFCSGSSLPSHLIGPSFSYQVPYLLTEMPTLRNLHTLSLNVVKESLDLRDIISLIAICPNLSMFEFSSLLYLLSYTERDEEVLPTCVHLKHLVLDGYKFDAAQKKFASQLLKCAPALEKMLIYVAYCLYYLGQDVEKTLPLKRRVFSDELISRTKQQLEQHASSSSTLVNISCLL
ncbi:hypothetical protein LIER_24219 [Lithospermum erythrorhizon]|uniref:Uncharacterized protein n=1 Tax=Lithospermum erythrorhizon TaxID=34254 RepID=A0AAV3R627_LITER